MKTKIIASINVSVNTLVMYCQMEYEPGQIEAATNNMADLIINNIVENLNVPIITNKWGMYKEKQREKNSGEHSGGLCGRRGKSILRRTRKQKGLRKRRGKKSQQKSRRNKRSSRM